MRIDLPVAQDSVTTTTVKFVPKQLPQFEPGKTPAANIYAYFKGLLQAIYDASPERELIAADGRKVKAKFAVSPAVLLQVAQPYTWTLTFEPTQTVSEGNVPLPVIVAFMLGWCGWYDEECAKSNGKPTT